MRFGNDIEFFFYEKSDRVIHKWKHYFEIYERHFSRFRGTEVHIVEFGVAEGGSLQMWKYYFGQKAKIYGVDINPDCKKFEDEQVKIFIGDQGNREFLRRLMHEIPQINILIDDGGHRMEQQIVTFEECFDNIDTEGIYLCEDLHTSYWKDFGGGYKKTSTYIEYSKNFIDYIHPWYSTTDKLKLSKFTMTAHSLHFYNSVLVIERRPMLQPISIQIDKSKSIITRFPEDFVKIEKPKFRKLKKIKRFFYRTFKLKNNDKDRIVIFPQSKLAHKYCVGSGLEIGGSAHNPFGLNTLNVDYTDSMDTIFKKYELENCGIALKVDIVASGDNIPLPDESQDFIVSSHCIEHFHNPIKALIEWDRLIKPGGIIFMIVPHKNRTFDKGRMSTTVDHVIQDFETNNNCSHEDENGHDHCWITEEFVEMIKTIATRFSMNWKIIEAQDIDDKVGNGFTIVIKKIDRRNC